MTLTAYITTAVLLKGKQFRPGARRGKRHRAIREFVSGDDLYHRTGEWVNLWRLFDRVANWYTEIIRDKKTGQITHETQEPLSDHRGHGDDTKT